MPQAPDASGRIEDPSLAAVDAREEAMANPKRATKYPRSHEALIRRFEKDNVVPQYEKEVVQKMDDERKYVHTDANLATVDGGVSTNYIFNAQQLHRAQLNARSPGIFTRPRKKVGEVDPELSLMLNSFSETMEEAIKHFFGPDEMDLRGVMDGAIQDVDTVGVVYLKLDWYEDAARDPVGSWRPRDFQTLTQTLTRLSNDFRENKFDKDSAEYAQLEDVARTVKNQIEAELWLKAAYPNGADGGSIVDSEDPRKLKWDGAPSPPQISELPKYRGFTLRSILPEDVRRDWSIFRPEEFRRSSHFTYRSMMTHEAAREFYGCTEEDLACAATGGRVQGDMGSTDQKSPADRNEEGVPQGHVCIWCRMDRAAGKIYHWREGAKHFLRVDEPDVTTTNWFCVFPMMFNRVTGRFLPLSNTTLGRPLQDEINLVRTHKRQAKRAAYDRFAAAIDLFDQDTLDAMEQCPPNGIFPTKKNVEDLSKGLYRMPGQFNPAVHDVMDERQELGVVLGQSQAAQGMTRGGSDTATEAAIANQASGSLVEYARGQVESVIRDIAVAMGEIMVQAMPEASMKAIVGPGAFWPMIGREQLWRHVMVEVEPGSTGASNREKDLSTLRETIEIGNAMGMGAVPGGPTWNPIEGMKKLAKINDWREDPKDLIVMPQLPVMDPAMAGGLPEGGGGAPTAPGQEIPGEVSGEVSGEVLDGGTAPDQPAMMASPPGSAPPAP
jgi:hypothetical protein